MIISKFDIFGIGEGSYFLRAHINFIRLSQTGCYVESLYITLLAQGKTQLWKRRSGTERLTYLPYLPSVTSSLNEYFSAYIPVCARKAEVYRIASYVTLGMLFHSLNVSFPR